MTEVTLHTLMELGIDMAEAVAPKQELFMRSLISTRQGQTDTFNTTLVYNEPTELQACIHTIAAAKGYDQLVLVTEAPGYEMQGISTAEIMRLTEGKAETIEELLHMVQDGRFPPSDIPKKYCVSMVIVVGQSNRENGRHETILLRVTGELPHRQLVPVEEVWGEMTNSLIPLLPKPVDEMTREERYRLGMAGIAMLQSQETVLMEYNDLDPTLSPDINLD